MKLEKVIEKLTAESEVATRTGRQDLLVALRIGIEAVWAWREHRLGDNQPELWLLPGETEE